MLKWFKAWLRSFTTSKPRDVQLDLSRRKFLVGVTATVAIIATPVLHHLPTLPENFEPALSAAGWMAVGLAMAELLRELASREGVMRAILRGLPPGALPDA